MAAPELGTRQSGSSRPRPGCLHTLAPGAPATSALTARSGARTRRRRCRRRCAIGDPSPAPPRPRPRPTWWLRWSPTPAPPAPPSVRPHFVNGKTEPLQRQFPSVIASKPDPGGLEAIQPLNAALRASLVHPVLSPAQGSRDCWGRRTKQVIGVREP